MKDKGEYNGTCNVTACTTKLPAVWYNHSTRKYYCKKCAMRLNPLYRADAMNTYNHNLLTLGKHE